MHRHTEKKHETGRGPAAVLLAACLPAVAALLPVPAVAACGPPLAAGHDIVCEGPSGSAGDRRVLASGITFVDKDNAGPADGTAEHPFASIGAAVAGAGENRTIFVYEADGVVGLPDEATPRPKEDAYSELVELARGLTLTSAVPLNGRPTAQVYATAKRPLLRLEGPGPEHGYPAALTLHPDCTLRRLRVETGPGFRPVEAWPSGDPDPEAALSGESGPGGEIRIEDNELGLATGVAVGLSMRSFPPPSPGRLVIRDNHIVARGERTGGIYLWFTSEESLGGLEISGNRIHLEGGKGDGILLALGSGVNGVPHLGDLLVQNNEIHTRGDYSDAIDIHFDGCTLGNPGGPPPLIADNRISTTGEDAHGIHLTQEKATVTTWDAAGRQSRAFISGNRITTGGRNADAILLDQKKTPTDEEIEMAAIPPALPAFPRFLEDNHITIVGEKADGIHMRLLPGASLNLPPDFARTRFITGNTVITKGRAAAALCLDMWGTLRFGGPPGPGSPIAANQLDAADGGIYLVLKNAPEIAGTPDPSGLKEFFGNMLADNRIRADKFGIAINQGQAGHWFDAERLRRRNPDIRAPNAARAVMYYDP